MRRLSLVGVILALATAMHLDWHAARPAMHHLSLGLRWHWLLAVPVFALVALYVQRAWPERRLAASVAIVGIAGFLAAGVEPGWEYWIESAPLDWAFGPLRLSAFATFTVAGIAALAVILGMVRRRA